MTILAYILFSMLFSENFATTEKEAFHYAKSDYTEWVCVKDNKGIALHERWVRVNDSLKVRERMGKLIVDCNIETTTHYLQDYNTVRRWMKGIKKVNLIIPEDKRLVYMVIQLPWPFANRDVVARYSTFVINGDNKTVKVESEISNKAPKSKCVRIKDYRATWALQRLANSRTQITFTTFSSEAPLFPQWIQEPVLKKVFFSNLQRLQAQLSQ